MLASLLKARDSTSTSIFVGVCKQLNCYPTLANQANTGLIIAFDPWESTQTDFFKSICDPGIGDDELWTVRSYNDVLMSFQGS